MIKIILLFISCTSICVTLSGQSSGDRGYNMSGGECLSHEQERKIIGLLQAKHKESTRLQQYAQSRRSVSFEFPLKFIESLENPGVFAVSNFVDHDEEHSGSHSQNILDYHCGMRTYDTDWNNHGGTDFFSWPLSWNWMDRNAVEVIAAAPGMIIDKADGNSDKNCEFCTNCSWNAVYIQHADGTVAWYGHLKRGSLTSKNTGDIVESGEYLGVVGSSGLSTGPHLHFHIWESNEYENVVDPYEGDCNLTTSQSLWREQEPYYLKQVAMTTVGTIHPAGSECRKPHRLNALDTMYAGENAIFTGYFRDAIQGAEVYYKIVHDNTATVFAEWTHILPQNWPASWNWDTWYLSRSMKQGDYTFSATYGESERASKFFLVNPLQNNPTGRDATISYNPETQELLILNTVDAIGINRVRIYNVGGKLLNEADFEYNYLQSLSNFAAGMYIIHVSDDNGLIKVQKTLVF